VKGIEPSCVAWEATVLPLNYTRGCVVNGGPFRRSDSVSVTFLNRDASRTLMGHRNSGRNTSLRDIKTTGEPRARPTVRHVTLGFTTPYRPGCRRHCAVARPSCVLGKIIKLAATLAWRSRVSPCHDDDRFGSRPATAYSTSAELRLTFSLSNAFSERRR
jgi:hypothetical protein